MCHGDDARATLWGGGSCVPLRIALRRGPLPTILLACIVADEGAGGGPELHDFLGVPAPAPRWRRQLAGPPCRSNTERRQRPRDRLHCRAGGVLTRVRRGGPRALRRAPEPAAALRATRAWTLARPHRGAGTGATHGGGGAVSGSWGVGLRGGCGLSLDTDPRPRCAAARGKTWRLLADLERESLLVLANHFRLAPPPVVAARAGEQSSMRQGAGRHGPRSQRDSTCTGRIKKVESGGWRSYPCLRSPRNRFISWFPSTICAAPAACAP